MSKSGRKAALSVVHVLVAFFVFAVIAGTVSLVSMQSYAAESDKTIQLVNNGTVAGIQGKQKSNVYFGNYPQSKNQGGGYKVEPIKWRVLQNTDGKVFLMADKLLDSQFFDDARHRTWDESNVRAWLNGYEGYNNTGFINKALSSDEQKSVAITVVQTPKNPTYDTPGGEDTSDRIFLLSAPEVTDTDSGFNSDPSVKDDARKGVFTDYSASLPASNSECVWTLRTKGENSGLQVTVHGDGSFSFGGIGISDAYSAFPKPIRPALKIDLGSVLFTSAAVNGKQSGDVGSDALKAAGTFDGKDWKLTVRDADRGFRISQTEVECRINDTFTLNYTGAVPGENEYISAMITDQTGAVLFYGRVAEPESASGTVDITVPKSIPAGTYDLKVFNEHYNGDMKTDYASEMSNISLTVDDPLVPYVNDAGRKQQPKVCKPVREDTGNTQTLSSGWYAVLEDVSTKRIAVNGNVDLILCDGATLDAIEGIAINANSSLTIWAQSMGANKGTLDASLKRYSASTADDMAGIGFDSEGTGRLTINGGNIIAKNSGCAAAIGGGKGEPGGNVVINGGKVITQATIGLMPFINNQAIGHGAGIPAAKPGEIELGKVKVSTDGGSSYLDSSDRAATCRLPSTEILIERCSDHKFENDVCKYCGAGRPVRIDDGNSDLQVTLGKQLTYNGKEQTQTVAKITLNGTDITDFCDISDNVQKDVGEYELTITADKECDYEGTVKWKFTIKEAAPKPDDEEADDAIEDDTIPVVNIDKANTVGNFKKRQMKIVFPANRKVDVYRIQYRLAGKKTWTNGWSQGTGTYTVKNLKKYSLCEFRIAGYVRLEDGTWVRGKWSKISYRYVNSVSLKKVSGGKRSIKVTWSKDGKGNGYRIQYSLKKSMTGLKTVKVNSKSSTKRTIKKLKKGKTYYIRIRPVKKRAGKVYLGILGATKKARVK